MTSPLPALAVHTQSTAQLQRAWCLMLVCSLFPTVPAAKALEMARWLFENRTEGAS